MQFLQLVFLFFLNFGVGIGVLVEVNCTQKSCIISPSSYKAREKRPGDEVVIGQ